MWTVMEGIPYYSGKLKDVSEKLYTRDILSWD